MSTLPGFPVSKKILPKGSRELQPGDKGLTQDRHEVDETSQSLSALSSCSGVHSIVVEPFRAMDDGDMKGWKSLVETR